MKKREPNDRRKRLRSVKSDTAQKQTYQNVVVGAPESDSTARQVTFHSFFQEVFPSVSRALGITLGDHDLGKEAAAEAMARAYARWAQVGSYDNPAGWVYRVGLNWARSLRRRLMRRGPSNDRGIVEFGPVADPAIHEAVTSLSVDLRAVVVCRLLLDWSTERSADALGIPEGTVKSRLHRAVGELDFCGTLSQSARKVAAPGKGDAGQGPAQDGGRRNQASASTRAVGDALTSFMLA